MHKDTPWLALKPGAPYGAKFGRYLAGLTLLERDNGDVILCGAMTCKGRESAERHAESYRGSNKDIDGGRISHASFLALVA